MPTVVSVQKRNNYQFRSLYSDLFAVKITTMDIADLADGAGANEDVTITGIALGDHVIGFGLGVSAAGITVTANVIATNTLRFRFQNESGGSVNLASQTVTVLIGRPDAETFA